MFSSHRRNAIAGALGVTVLTAAVGAQAHVVLNPPEAAAGTSYLGAFRIGHGCAGAATTSLRIEFPAEVTGVKPQAKAGWAIEIERESLAVPIPGEGARLVSDRVKAITWRGKLPDDQFDEFGVMARLPATGGPIYFTAVQTCDAIIERWEERPAPGQTSRDLRHPAPMLKLTGAAPVTPVTATAAVPVPLPQNVKLANGALVTATGAPLYLFKHDTMVGMSHCEGECSAAWPPLRALASKPPKGWSKVERVDGSLQWAFQDRPLYTTTLTGSRLAEALAPGGAWAPARVSAGR